jgi:uncharacterized protein YycO
MTGNPNPQPGDFFLLAGTDPVGRLIEVAEWLNGDGFSTYSHAGILLDHTGSILEAEPGGARIAHADEYRDQLVWSSWSLTQGDRLSLVRRARGLVGVPYSALDYFAMLAHRIHLPMPGLKRYIAADAHMICSQLVDETYRRAGFQMFRDGRWPGYVTPQDLAQVLTGPQT